jgi:enoyl-CoA hydratase/carnithine racemase
LNIHAATRPLAEIERRGDTVAIRLDRGDRGNALNPQLVMDIGRAFDAAATDGARLVVFSGAGRHFCAGFDLSDLAEQSDGDLLARFVNIELLLQKIDTAPVTTVAVAHGRTIGAGADILVACDHRICLPDARVSFPGAAFGLVLGSRRLAQRVGRDRARDIVMSGRDMSAAHALEIGLATAVVAPEDVGDRIAEIEAAASRLDATTTAAVHRLTSQAEPDRDLAALVRSAARDGLKARIEAYRGDQMKKKVQ